MSPDCFVTDVPDRTGLEVGTELLGSHASVALGSQRFSGLDKPRSGFEDHRPTDDKFQEGLGRSVVVHAGDNYSHFLLDLLNLVQQAILYFPSCSARRAVAIPEPRCRSRAVSDKVLYQSALQPMEASIMWRPPRCEVVTRRGRALA